MAHQARRSCSRGLACAPLPSSSPSSEPLRQYLSPLEDAGPLNEIQLRLGLLQEQAAQVSN